MKEFRMNTMTDLLKSYSHAFSDDDIQLLMAAENDWLDLEATEILSNNFNRDLGYWKELFETKYAHLIAGDWELRMPKSSADIEKDLTARIENQEALSYYLQERRFREQLPIVGKGYKARIDKLDEDDLNMLHYDGQS